MHKFNEHHPALKGFSEYFAKDVQPILESREDERKERLKKYNTYGTLIVLAALMFAVMIYKKEGELGIYLAMAIFTAIALMALYEFTFKNVTSFTKEKIVGEICRYVGWQFVVKPVAPHLNFWSSLMLIPSGYETKASYSSMRASYEDEISGQAHGAMFKSTEVKLTRKSGKNTVTDFHGQLMSITFPRQFMGRTIVLQDKGFLQGKKKADMKRVGLVDPAFEKLFEAYGTDQVEARYLLTPVFMQTLIDLESSIGGKNIRFGFDKNQLFIAVDTGNQFEAGSMLEPLTNPARTQKILDEIGAVYNIVDVVSRTKRG